jgi:hypothetical protein
VTRNPCRSVHVDFIPGTDDGSEMVANQSGTATIVQQSMNPVSATVLPQTVGSLDARLVPGQSWSLNVTQDTFEGSRILTWYVNGTVSCYSRNIGTS